MSLGGDIARSAIDLLTPEGQTDRLTFKRFKGEQIAKAAISGTAQDVKPVDVVSLKINPYSISYSKPKITQKVQTSAPDRFVIYDWGTDLQVMTINGNTGMLLPTVIQSGYDPIKPLIDQVIQKIAPGDPTVYKPKWTGGEQFASINRIVLGKMTYFELLNMSPKYRAFKRLEKLYEKFDSDRDVLVLELGEDILRIFMNDFTFEQTADSPWNWKYTIVCTALSNLTDMEKRGDEDFSLGPVDETQ